MKLTLFDKKVDGKTQVVGEWVEIPPVQGVAIEVTADVGSGPIAGEVELHVGVTPHQIETIHLLGPFEYPNERIGVIKVYPMGNMGRYMRIAVTPPGCSIRVTAKAVL